MNKSEARILVETYVAGWKSNNIKKVLEPLAQNCKVIESHGPTYYGVEQIKKWIEQWVVKGSKVLKWDIDSFFFTDDSAFFEWSFTCVDAGVHYVIDGASVVLFENGKIKHIHEYRMTKPAFKVFGTLRV